MIDELPKPPRKTAEAAAADAIAKASATTGENMQIAADATQTTVDKVRDSAASLASEATGAARYAATHGKDKAAEALGGLSKLADDAAKAVDQHLGPNYGDYARKASVSVANAAESLQNKDVDTIMADAGEFVRKRPAVVIGTLAAVGVVLAGMFMPRRTKDDTKV